MIRFFRTIRHGLINEGKTSKYFRYAIGEIVLVVVGILIALQVNNWNIARGEAKLEQEYIQRLIAEVERDLEGINRRKETAEFWKELIQLVKDAYFDTEVAFARPAEFIAAVKHADIIEPATIRGDSYEELRSTGHLRLIKDDHLRSALFEYYRYHEDRRYNDHLHQMRVFKYIELSNEVLSWHQVELGIGMLSPDNPDNIEKARQLEVDEDIVLSALKRMRENDQYVSWIQEVYNIRGREIRVYDGYIKRADTLLKALRAAQEEES